MVSDGLLLYWKQRFSSNPRHRKMEESRLIHYCGKTALIRRRSDYEGYICSCSSKHVRSDRVRGVRSGGRANEFFRERQHVGASG